MTKSPKSFFLISILIATLGVISQSCRIGSGGTVNPLDEVRTIAGPEDGIGEPFGIAERNGDIYFSDGERGEIRRILRSGAVETFADGLDTPSQIAFDGSGNLIVSDSGSHTIKRISAKGEISVVAGMKNRSGFQDGDARSALFHAPVGIAVISEKIYVADTYNDRIRIIERQGVVSTIGRERGFADGPGSIAMFDTPLGIAAWGERLLVADAGNRRIRVIEPGGSVWTLAGTGGGDLVDGLPASASFVRPTALTVSQDGTIFIADGNAIRAIGRRAFTYVETISNDRRGFRDGGAVLSQFNRPSGLAVGEDGVLFVADSDNGLIRSFQGRNSTGPKDLERRPKQFTAEEFRNLQPARWPYDPPEAPRDVAGTLGEIRGEIVDGNSRARFHNGLDIAGAYGETARFIRDEKVLDPMSAENFGTLRELLRMPTIGYIHINLGRDVGDTPFGDGRFIFSNLNGKLNDVRVPRGAKFKAGEPIGTLNAMNHIHMIAGRNGHEMNALNALLLPGIADTIDPVIENVSIFDENWREIETDKAGSRIQLTGKTRIVVRAFDRMDGNPERRKLGIYKLGYRLIKADGSPVGEIIWTVKFDRMPPFDAVNTVYAPGSKSGPTGETIFNYIVTNRLSGDDFGEGFLDPAWLEAGAYTLKVFAADFFGNQASKDIQIQK
jgi:sugar lactone lactonase YvrE